MKIELNYYKESGKWYTKEIEELPADYDIDDIPAYIMEGTRFTDMFVTVHIIEDDNSGAAPFKQPYRFYKL